jgi:ferredoxin-NADP reductase
MRDIMQTGADRRFTLLYGVTSPAEALYREEFDRMEKESSGRIIVRYVLSEPDPSWKGETGFLTADTIKKLSGGVEGKSVFICGPQAMYNFLEGELKSLSVPRRRIRREACGTSGRRGARCRPHQAKACSWRWSAQVSGRLPAAAPANAAFAARSLCGAMCLSFLIPTAGAPPTGTTDSFIPARASRSATLS